MPTKTLKIVRARFTGAYGDILVHLREILESNGLGRIFPDYDAVACPCYNIGPDGDAYLIQSLKLDEDGMLCATDPHGNLFPLGDSIDSQDNYTLSAPLQLLDATVSAVTKLSVRLIKIRPSTHDQMLQVLRDWLGKDGDVAFEHGFPRPSLRQDEEIVSVSHDAVVSLILPSRLSHVHPLESLGTVELKRLAKTLNDYTVFCATEA